MKNERKKVLVGMSGGVDSSVAAAILKKQGYDVTGLFMLMHNCEKVQKDMQDAKEVCAKIGIEFFVIDVGRRFKKEVVKYFLDEYATGRTPNPCIFCNENFKFKILFEQVNKLDMNYVATGHYARITREISNSKSQISNKSKIKNLKSKTIYKLKTAKDKNKDQSYFLYRLGQKELAKIIFPLGEYEKVEIKKMAKKFCLPVYEKNESQDICFLDGLTTELFLKKNIKMKEGKIADSQGKILGKHLGLPLYTLGQRKNINIGGDGPYYVVAKNFKKNTLVVTNNKRESELFSRSIELKEMRWTESGVKMPIMVLVQTRYREKLIYATIKPQTITDKKFITDKMREECVVEFEKPEKRVASGQSVVFYSHKGEVIGGGIVQ